MLFSKKGRILTLVVSIFLVLGFSKAASAQELILNDLNGKKVNLSAYRGKPAILFFWTTWCPYCRKEIKALNQMYPQLKKEGITVFAVDIGEADYVVQRVFVADALSFGVLLDKDGSVADKYNVIGVPTYVFIGKSGQVTSDEHVLPIDYKKLLFN